MKKILFAIDSLSGGGAERVISLLANQIHAWGYTVDILLAFDTKVEYEIADGIGVYDINGARVNTVQSTVGKAEPKPTSVTPQYYRPPNCLQRMRYRISEYRDRQRRIKRVAEFVNNGRYDAVVSFLTSTNELVGAASKKFRAKAIISERCAPVETVITQDKGKWTLKQYAKADRIVFQTPDAMHCYPIKIQRKGAVIPNPIKTDLPARFEGERKKEIVTFGRLDKQKNLPMLIRAFAEIVKKYPDYTLHFFGRGQEKDNLIALVNDLGLQDKVVIEGFASNVHEIIKDKAMYVSTSDYEGISNSMLEALAIGLPCICTDCPVGGARLAIQDRENGILIGVKDEKALIQAMEELISSAELSERLSVNAVKLRERWAVDEIAKRWLEVVEE